MSDNEASPKVDQAQKPEKVGSPSELTIQTKQEEQPLADRPTSPPRSPTSKNQILSPKSSGSRRPQSPGVYKGKLEIVKKFLTTEQEKYSKLNSELIPLTEEKQMLQKQWEQKQLTSQSSEVEDQNIEGLQKEISELKKNNTEINLKVDSLKKTNQHKISAEKQLLSAKIKTIQNQIEIKRKNQQQKQQSYQKELSQVQNLTREVEGRVINLNHSLQQQAQKKQEIIKAQVQLQQSKQAITQDLANTTNSQKLLVEKRRATLEDKINQVRERINQQKKSLSQLGNKEVPAGQPSTQEINQAKSSCDALQSSIKKVEASLAAKKKQASSTVDEEKKKEKKVNDLRKSIDEAQKKREALETEIKNVEIQTKKKKVQYEQKAPEELLVLRSKNQMLMKETKRITDKLESEKAELEKLVPPSVIQSMNKKISTIISSHQRLNEISGIIGEISHENEKLADQRESLEWGENNYLRELQSERKKQEEKNKALEEELLAKKKGVNQIHSKLEQYVLSYPDFKPKKKPEVEKSQKQVKKGSSNNANESDRSPTLADPKKKKNVVQSATKAVSSIVENNSDEPKKNKKKKKTSEVEIVNEEVKPENVQVAPKFEKKQEVKIDAEPVKKKNKKR